MSSNSLQVLLQPKHKVFADEYLICGNSSAAARKAGYSVKCSGVTGSKLLRRPDVKAYLAAQAAKVTEQTEDLQSQVLRELKTMAFVDVASFFRVDSEGQLVADFSAATPEQLKAISSVVSSKTTRTSKDGSTITETQSRVAIADKYRGLELLGKHVGMFKEPDQRVVVDVADRLLTARRRFARSLDDEGGGGGVGV